MKRLENGFVVGLRVPTAALQEYEQRICYRVERKPEILSDVCRTTSF